MHDRIYAIRRLINKSNYSHLLLAYVFYDLLNSEYKFECEMFPDYLRQLIDHHSSELIVFDLLQIYCQKNENQQQQILKLLQQIDTQESLPMKQTNQLLLILKLFPNSVSITETIYKTLVNKTIIFFQTSNENNL